MTQAKTQDLIEVLLTDHNEFRSLFDELERTTDPQRRRHLTDVVIAEVTRHAVAEEMFLYPAARREVPGGDEIVEHEIGEHAEGERIMKDLEDLRPTDPEFDGKLAAMIHSVRHHLDDEETKLFPKMRQHCTPEELRELGRKILLGKRIAPTRPHPDAPDRPPLNLLVAPGVGLVDRVRDLIARRPTEPEDLRSDGRA
jgi:hemerythrin-like domain-containing protein